MQYAVCVVALLACLPLFALGQNPAFCRHLDCPSYSVIESTADYEIRRYDAATWVTSEALNSKGRSRSSFMKLFGYIRGGNVAADGSSMSIKMTVPVVKATSENSMTTMFYINVPNAPTPTDSSVKFWDMPQTDYYVRAFNTESRTSREKYRQEVVALKNAIGSPTLYNTTVWYTAGYHSPRYVGVRHNEVWLQKL